MSDLKLLGGDFMGPSWALWKICMKAAWAERLTKREVAAFKSVAGDREPPARPVGQIVAIVGRRGGQLVRRRAGLVLLLRFRRAGSSGNALSSCIDRECGNGDQK